jgi:hypothetical protein
MEKELSDYHGDAICGVRRFKGLLLETCRKVIAEHLSEPIDATGLRRGLPEIYLYTLPLVVLPLTPSLPWNSYADYFTGPVVSVPNGDTIEVLHGNNPERICFNGIDCPEKNQAYDTRAEQATSERVFRSFHNHLFLALRRGYAKHHGRSRHGRHVYCKVFDPRSSLSAWRCLVAPQICTPQAGCRGFGQRGFKPVGG